jgi:GTP-binding protein
MSMVDGVCLVVCATEGPMPQTKFVLKKALSHGLKPIVVINKVDRDSARVEEVENEIFDLFCLLEANDEQLEYPLIYASARNGWAIKDRKNTVRDNVDDLFTAIVSHVPHPTVD